MGLSVDDTVVVDSLQKVCEVRTSKRAWIDADSKKKWVFCGLERVMKDPSGETVSQKLFLRSPSAKSTMSGLGSLFSGFSANADSNDALKYSAPKEPKSKAPKPATSALTATERSTPTPVTPTPPVVSAKTPGPSKIMAPAAVRLYKVNPATGAYDAIEGGGVLGCVLMGTNLTFQILVYNSKKAPMATVAIGAGFDYTVRDQYVSFADAAGNQWSLLFDSIEVMTAFLRTLAATVMHMSAFGSSEADATSPVRRLLPRTPSADNSDETALAAGMSAGVYLTAWELQEAADYPSDILSGSVLKRIQAPEDVLKVKIAAGEDAVGGLSEALQGLRKGDRCLVGLPPRVFYAAAGGGEGCIDPSKRAFPGSWVLLELEVVKMKSGEAKGSKKDKGSRKEEAPAPAAPAPRTESPREEQSEVTARMARVAASGGGGGAGAQLAGIMRDRRESGDLTHDRPRDSPPANAHPQSQAQAQQHRQQPQHQAQPYYQQGGQDRFDGHDQHRSSQQGSQGQQGGYVESRLAVVEGQGVRSFYTDQGEEDSSYHQFPSRQPPYARGGAGSGVVYADTQQQQQQQQQQQSLQSQQTASSLNTLHQSVTAVQQSMLSLHTKLDQVGAQVVTSTALIQQQQQQQQALVAGGAQGGFGQVGMGMLGGGMGMGMGIAGLMSPFQQQQQQMQMMMLQQQQQQHQQTSGPTPARLKTEELVSTLQALLAEFERGGGGSGRGDSAAKEAEAKELVRGLRASVERLEAKNEVLQGRCDKLLGEKAEVMDKYLEQMQSGSANTNKLYQLTQEAEALRQSRAELQREVDALRAAGAGSGAASNEREQEQKVLIAELQNKVVTLQMECAELRQELDRRSADSVGATSQADQKLQAAVAESQELRDELAAAGREKAALIDSAARLQSDLAAEREERRQEQRRSAETAVALEAQLEEARSQTLSQTHAQAEEQAVELEALRAKLAAAEATVQSLTQAMDGMADKAVQAAEQSAAQIAALQEQLATASASGGNDELKDIMQDVYVRACEVFDTEAPDSADTQFSAQDVVKRLRGVLKKVTTERTTSP